MVAIVIPVRPGEDNPELRCTLRSIHKHVPDPDIWVVGHRPKWLRGVRWIPSFPTGMKSDRGCEQTRTAADHPDVPDAFWWWDDDMFRLTPLFGPEVRHGGPISDWLEKFNTVESRYAAALRRTAARIGAHGAVKMYDLHVPFWIRDKGELAATMRMLPHGTGGWLWRTVHGNRLRLGGTGHPDVKVYTDDPIPDPPGQWLSSDDGAFPRVWEFLRPRWPEESPWEGPPDQPNQLWATYRRGDLKREMPFRRDTNRTLLLYGWELESLIPAGQSVDV